MNTPETCGSLADIRAEIDRIDQQIIALIAERAAYVQAAARFKTSETAVRADDRYQAMLQRRRAWAQARSLDPDVIEQVYRTLVDHFIAQELQQWRQHRQDYPEPDKV